MANASHQEHTTDPSCIVVLQQADGSLPLTQTRQVVSHKMTQNCQADQWLSEQEPTSTDTLNELKEKAQLLKLDFLLAITTF